MSHCQAQCGLIFLLRAQLDINYGNAIVVQNYMSSIYIHKFVYKMSNKEMHLNFKYFMPVFGIMQSRSLSFRALKLIRIGVNWVFDGNNRISSD